MKEDDGIAIPELGLEFKANTGPHGGYIAYVGHDILTVPSIIALGLATKSL